jgi:hypothetical protein
MLHLWGLQPPSLSRWTVTVVAVGLTLHLSSLMVSRCSRRVIVGRLLTRHGIEGRRRWWCLPRILDVDSQSVYV